MSTLPESDVLDWQPVLRHLESQCQTGYGRLRITTEKLAMPDVSAVRHELLCVDEAKRLIQRYGDMPLIEPPDVIATVLRLQKQGEFTNPAEAWDLLTALRTLRQLARFFIQHRSREETPVLLPKIEALVLPNTAVDLLETVVDDTGDIKESASAAYAQLKRKAGELRLGIRNTLQRFISRPATAKFLQEPLITWRDGRAVLPVRAEHKVDVPGVVLDTSATGVTLYIEPRSVVEQNNRLLGVQNDLAREARKILSGLASGLLEHTESLLTFITAAADLDVLLAKARQSLIFNAEPIDVLETSGRIHLKCARHPVLVLQKATVVANDIVMAPPHHTMLITGPNTGGKTVLLKLVGLFALMTRCGLHLPVAEGSSMSLFDPVLADIGDAQSLTQNLSTFSGHINRLNSFLNENDLSKALVLIDEICAGTDPQEGVALSKAVLNAFQSRGATTLVTTHIGELKVFAYQQEGYLNASVLFDTETLSPTYRLVLGVPGTSHALNIASRLGMDIHIVEHARDLLVRPQTDSAELIESLETKTRAVSEELDTVRKLRTDLEWEEDQMRRQLDKLEGEKQKTLQQYRQTLRDKLRPIEDEVESLKESLKRRRRPPTSGHVQRLGSTIRGAQTQSGEVFAQEGQKLYQHNTIAWDALQVGDVVASRKLNMSATILEKHASRKELTLQAGMLKTTVPLDDIMRKTGSMQASQSKSGRKNRLHKPQANNGSGSKVMINPRAWQDECDVRGMNAEDAIGVLEKFLDDAMITGVTSVGVIHGLGTGVLKKSLRAYLKNLPYVKSFGPATAMDGGDGKTLIEL